MKISNNNQQNSGNNIGFSALIIDPKLQQEGSRLFNQKLKTWEKSLKEFSAKHNCDIYLRSASAPQKRKYLSPMEITVARTKKILSQGNPIKRFFSRHFAPSVSAKTTVMVNDKEKLQNTELLEALGLMLTATGKKLKQNNKNLN